jgi:hypothetical protein
MQTPDLKYIVHASLHLQWKNPQQPTHAALPPAAAAARLPAFIRQPQHVPHRTTR